MSKIKDINLEETFKLAAKNHQENKTDIAQELYNQVLKVDPNHLGALNNLGVLFKKLNQIQKAKDCYEKVIQIDPNNIDTHYNLGNALKELKDFQKAKDCYEKVIKINPSHENAHYNLGVVFKELGDLRKALSYYEKVIKINPSHENAYYNLGAIFVDLKEYQKAKDCYEKAIEINPNLAQAYNNIGLILSLEGKIKKAENFYEKAIKINPTYADAHNNLAKGFKELGEYTKAKDYFEKTIEIDPNHLSAYSNLANLFYLIGEFQKAKECFEKAIQIKPGNVHTSNGLLKSIYKIDDKSNLFKELDSIIKEGKINAVIGSIFSRAEVKYGVKKENPFCNDPLHYVLKKDLTEKYDFKNVIADCMHNILKNDSISNKTQELITNGYQTAGNLFANQDFDTHEVQKIIRIEVEKYRLHFEGSKEGFMRNWPTKYSLIGWLINMKKGGKLFPHMHDLGWLSGSIYINIPKKLEDDDGNLVVCVDDDENKRDKSHNKKSIDVVTGSLCLFPSSLLHYTVPFEAEENRIVLAFDVTPS